MFPEKARRGVLSGAEVFYSAGTRGKNHLLAFPFVLVTADVALVLDDLVAHARERRGPIVVIVLRPAFVGMVVALGALQACAQEDLRHGFRARDRIAIRAIIVRCRISIRAAARDQNLARKLVQGYVLRYALANPVVEVLHALVVKGM